jgi:hypothetical protein
MARRYQSQPSFEGIDSNIYSGAEREADLAIAKNPNAYSYSYGDLNEKYPISVTRPINPVSIQEDIDEQELKRKTNEIAYKEKQYQMQLMDSQLNRENARLTQAPAIRKEISNLNPQSDDFEKQLIDIYQRNPIGYEDKALQDYIIRPLLNTHNQYIQNKNYMDRLNQRPMSVTEMDKANDLYFDLSTMKSAGEPMSQAQEEMLLTLEARMSGSGSTRQPSTQGQQQVVNPQTQQRNYSPKQQEALQWLQQNPNDPRAELIKRKLGI